MRHRILPALFWVAMAMIVATDALAASTTEDEPGSISLKNGSLSIKTGDQTFEIGGVLMWDVDFFDGVHTSTQEDDWISRTELRRAKLNIKSKLSDRWRAKLQFAWDTEDESLEIDDAYVSYMPWRRATLLLGQAKEPFGLEALTSSKNIAFIERAMASRAFSPGRNPGLSLGGDLPRWTWRLGVYQAQDRDAQGDTYALTGRLTTAPFKSKTAVLHLGAAGSVRDYDGGIFEIKETAEVYTAQEITNTTEIDTDQVTLYGFEAALAVGPFSLQAEYMSARINALDASGDATLSGYYVQTGWFLTGESRSYRKGRFIPVKPLRSTGAWEVVGRYSVLDTLEDDAGVTAENYTLGLNWYANRHIRLMTDYIHTQVSDSSTSDAPSTGDAVSLRVQYAF